MELLQRIAMAHYQAGSDEVQGLARDFFRTMDSNGDGKIDMREFLMFMTQEGYSCMGNSHIFYHRHNYGPSRFLDNYTLLEAKKNSDRNQLRYQPSTTIGQDGASMPWPQPSLLQSSWSMPPPSAISPAVANLPWPPPSTSPGPGGVTNLNYNALVQNFATAPPNLSPSTATAPPNLSPSTANSLAPGLGLVKMIGG
ncbi:hypothetical protein RJ640_011978 [Escallonia rubra]|uniref:EF-hand domain-containing protein n=1 Tax=Escallonia rubra TaxID=112253 RepID=A0AA88UU56_9ASTE|nr:hypothetical protein RJ640_011978 [Escallonia rubra]